MRAYLLTYNSILRPEYVHERLNSSRAIQTWLSPFPYVAILISNLTLIELTAVLRTHFNEVWFILVEVTQETTNGYLPLHFWDYINDPQSTWSRNLFGKLPKLPPASSLPPSLEELLGLQKKQGE